MLFGIALTLAGAVSLALYRVLVSKVLKRGETADNRPGVTVLNSMASAVSMLTLLAVFFASGGDADIRPGFWSAVLISGICNAVISTLMFKALSIKGTDVSLIVPIADTTPVAIVILAMFITDEHPTAQGYAGIVLLVAGTYALNIQALIEKRQQGWSVRTFLAPFLALGRSRGVLLAFIASVIGCVSISYDAIATRSGHPLLAIACIMIGPTVFNVVVTVFIGAQGQWIDRKRLMPWAGGLGVFHGAAVGLFGWSFLHLLVAYQATVKRVETFFVLLLARWILGERKHFATRLVAVALLLVGITLIAWQR